MSLFGGVSIDGSASGSVSLHPLTTGKAIILGPTSDTVGTGPLALSDTELDAISAGTINIGDANTGPILIAATINRAAGSTTAINLTTGTNNNIAFTGNGKLDAANGNVTLLTNSSGTGAITSGTAAIDVSGASVSLTAGSGGIGASGNPLVVSATNLNATTGGNGNQFLSASGSTTIDATGLSAGTGTIELDAGTFTLGGSNRISDSTKLNVNGATFAIGANSETVGGLTLTSGSVTGTTGILTSTTTYQTQSGSISAILAGSVGLTQSTTGTTTLSGANTFSGNTTISNGTLKLGAADVIPDGTGNGNVVMNSGGGNTATLDLGGFSETINGLSGAGIVDNSAVGGPYTLTVGGNNATSTFSGGIKNTTGTLALTKTGTGTFTLGGVNSYSGVTTINQGTLRSGGNAFPDAGDVTIGAAGTFDLADDVEIGALNGAGAVTGGSDFLRITNGGNYAGSISGTIILVVDGPGKTFTLSGTNTYFGTTTVISGTLLVNGINSASGGFFGVESGATLGGTGLIDSLFGIQVESGGHLAPGAAGPGILSARKVNFKIGSNFDVTLNGTTVGSQYSQQNMTGPVALGPVTILNVALGITPVIGDTFTIINNDATDAVSGTFNGLPEGKIFTVTTGSFTGTFQITYQGGDGNDVVLTAANAPPTLDPISNRTVAEDAATQTVSLTGISAGGDQNQTISITATSNNPAVVPNPNITYSSPNGTGSLSFKPVADQFGTAVITVTVKDNGGTAAGGDTLVRTFTINVTEVNDPPIANPDAATVAEDSVGNIIDVLSNDSPGPANESSQTLKVTAASAQHGAVTINANGTLSYSPAADYNGPDTISYSIVDDGTTDSAPDPLTADGTVAVTVTEVNDPPAAVNDLLPSVAEDSGDGLLAFSTLLANDSKGPANESSQMLAITGISNVMGGTAVILGDNIAFTPADDYNGTFSFVYNVLDNGTTNGINDFRSSSGTVSFAVTEINDPPTGVDDVLASILEDAAQTIHFATLLGNDLKGPANESSQTLTITAVDSPVGGTVDIVGTDVIFTPTADYNGPAGFVYTLVDNGTTNGQPDPKVSTATVSFTIDPVNDAPVFVKGGNQAATDENPATHGPALPIVVHGWATNMAPGPTTATDEMGQHLTFTVTTNNDGLFAVKPAVDAATGDLTFRVKPNADGTAHISVVLKDDGGTANGGVDASAAQTFDIVITKPHIWHNTKNALDVNDDIHIAANDVVAVVNYINAFGNINGGRVPALGAPLPSGIGVAGIGTPFGFLDVNADDFVAANDALAIINVINAGQAGGEGEAASAKADNTNTDVDLFTLLAVDVASQGKRRGT
jgi:autotransporter-associated beta strand protein/VCBS repeat-containing protein